MEDLDDELFFQCGGGKSHNPNDVEFLFYHEPRVKDLHMKLIYLKKHMVTKSPFNSSKPTKVLIHGLTSSAGAEFSQMVKNAYLENQHRNEENIIVVNWRKLAAQNQILFFEVVKRVDIVAKRIADFLLWLGRAMSVDLRRDVHLVGYGLGAHIAGIVGNHVIAKHKRLGRITGLDPQDAGYVAVYHHKNLEKNDAFFVDVYHTNELQIESWNLFGHVDFFVNTKTAQPFKSLQTTEREDENAIAHRLFAQSIIDGPYGNNLTSQFAGLNPFAHPQLVILGEYCLPGTHGWFDITY